MRKITIRAIAVVFIFLGVKYLVDFLSPFFVTSADKSLNLTYLVYSSFLYYAGFNLYKLKDSGRNLTLALLSIRLITNLAFSTWVLFIFLKGESFRIDINFLNKNYPFAEYRIEFAVIMLIWSFIVLLMIAFLLQKKSKEIFSPEKNSFAPQSEVAP
jgi:hypothetical protein